MKPHRRKPRRDRGRYLWPLLPPTGWQTLDGREGRGRVAPALTYGANKRFVTNLDDHQDYGRAVVTARPLHLMPFQAFPVFIGQGFEVGAVLALVFRSVVSAVGADILCVLNLFVGEVRNVFGVV